MKKLIPILSAALLFAFAEATYADDDELAPGHAQCMERAEDFEAEADCYQKAHQYQSHRLDRAYKEARKLCDQANNPAQCKNELKKLELAWLDFENRTHVYMLNEGVHGPYQYDLSKIPPTEYPGRSRQYAESFSAAETKRQADRMELFHKFWERWQ